MFLLVLSVDCNTIPITPSNSVRVAGHWLWRKIFGEEKHFFVGKIFWKWKYFATSVWLLNQTQCKWFVIGCGGKYLEEKNILFVRKQDGEERGGKYFENENILQHQSGYWLVQVVGHGPRSLPLVTKWPKTAISFRNFAKSHSCDQVWELGTHPVHRNRRAYSVPLNQYFSFAIPLHQETRGRN